MATVYIHGVAKNQMVLSIEKTNTLFISSKYKHNSQVTCGTTSSVMIDHNKLEEIENAKLLGDFVDSTLSWKKQAAHVEQRVSFTLEYANISRLKLEFYFTIII